MLWLLMEMMRLGLRRRARQEEREEEGEVAGVDTRRERFYRLVSCIEVFGISDFGKYQGFHLRRSRERKVMEFLFARKVEKCVCLTDH